MIYGNTNHPVEIKKIKIRIWRLRDELEAVIGERAELIGVKSLTKAQLSDLMKEYHGHINHPKSYLDELGIPSETLEIVEEPEQLDDSEDEMAAALADAGQLDDSEDAMAAALAGGGDEVADAGELDDSEDAMAAALAGGDVADAGELDDSEDAMAAALAGASADAPAPKVQKTDNNSVIKLRRPKISEDKVSDGITFLNDVNMETMAFFSKKQFIKGQSIIIEFLIPNYFILSAEVLMCRKYNMASKIISPTRPDYRVHAKFLFSKKGERTLLRRFVKSIEPDIPPERAAAPKVEDEDDLDDLDELGL